jgi:hypothetical protein
VGYPQKWSKLLQTIESKCDLQNALLEYRNTTIESIGASPSEVAFNRLCKTKLPVHPELLKPKIINVKENIKKYNQKVKNQYDKTSKCKNYNFQEGEKIQYWDQNKHIWEHGTLIAETNEPRSYNIIDKNDKIKRRNSVFLRKDYHTHD